MLYELHEMQHASLSMLRLWAKGAGEVCRNPMYPVHYTSFGKSLAAGSDLLLRATRRYEKPQFGLTETTVKGRKIAVTQHAILVKPFCNLLRFKHVDEVPRPRVLLVAPLSGHHATLLRDTVKAFLADFDVYITDWIDAKRVPLSEGGFHFDDYIAYVQDFVRALGPNLHVVSVCQPTVPVLAAIALMAANGEKNPPRSMVMMGGPIDTRKNPTTVNDFAKQHTLAWFESKVIYRVPIKYPGYTRKVYPGFLQHAGFIAMNPGRHIDSHLDYYMHLVEGDGEGAGSHRKFYDEYNAVMDLPAEYYLETIERVFHRQDLALGQLVSRGQPVRPEAIRKTALLTVEGELDDISGNGQTAAAHDLCRNIPESRRKHLVAPEVGHYGIFSGRRFRESIYPEIRDFVLANK
jgi:poly(3-hydroxybutyrate) depolymerase